MSDLHNFASHIWNVVSKYRQMKKLKIIKEDYDYQTTENVLLDPMEETYDEIFKKKGQEAKIEHLDL